MLICLFTSSTLWALRCLSLSPPFCLPVCLASLAQGLHEHRYYEAVVNNRSSSALATEGRSSGERRRRHRNMATQTPEEWGTLLEGCNLLELSLSFSSARLLTETAGLHLKVSGRGIRICITSNFWLLLLSVGRRRFSQRRHCKNNSKPLKIKQVWLSSVSILTLFNVRWWLLLHVRSLGALPEASHCRGFKNNMRLFSVVKLHSCEKNFT